MKSVVPLLLFLLVGAAAGVELVQIVNPAQLNEWSPAARKLLAANGLVARPAYDVQFYDVYKRLAKNNTPMFVTTDCALHSFHILYDYTVRELETRYLAEDLKSLTVGLIQYETIQQRSTKNAAVKAALSDNVAYLAVARSLLDSSYTIPKSVSAKVRAELALIGAHADIAQSPLMGYQEDYTQYVPRGHYTRSELLKRYFKAMMWYGRIGFLLKPGNTDKDVELGRRLTRQALLLADALKQARAGSEKAQDVWSRIYDVTAFLVGKSDDLNAGDYLDVAAGVYGGKSLLSALGDRKKLDDFIAQAMARQPPKIVSQVVPDTLKPEQVTKGLRFMGQRYIPDSYMFQELVYTKVGTQPDPRLMPRGLDVLAVLGSDRAREILKDVYNEDHYANYAEQIAKLRAEFARLTSEEWSQNVYFGWIEALKLQNAPIVKSQFLPDFCFVPAYADKCLVTSGGSWAQLRHDTILYAKQSYTMMVTAMPPREEPATPVVYVEPRPEVFAQIESLATRMASALKARGVLSDQMESRLTQLQRLAATLSAIAGKETRGEKPADDEIAETWRIGKIMEDFSESPGAGATSDADKSIETVADVHTDPNSGMVLEEAVGRPLLLSAVAPFNGKPYAFSGAMFSYYEFQNPMASRMTDEQWQSPGTKKPAMPEWSSSFVNE